MAAAAGMGALLLVREVRERRNGGPGTAAKPASRQFRLGESESIPAGLVRIAEGRLDDALDHLSGRSGADTTVAVHETRKNLKKLRALTRLVQADPGWNERFRDTARRLAGRRDTDVLLQTLDAFVERGEMKKKAVKGLRKQILAEAGREADNREIELAHAELTIARNQIADLAPDSNAFKELRPGLQEIYGEGRARYRSARRKSSTGNLHEWRKRVKDLWYSASVLRPAWPAMMKELEAEADILSELLGEDHDLAMLAERAKGKKHKQLRKLIAKRRAGLRKRAFKLGRRLYAEKPKGFSRRVGEAWKAAH